MQKQSKNWPGVQYPLKMEWRLLTFFSWGFSQPYLPKGELLQPLRIIYTEGLITLNLLPVYRYGHPLSIDIKVSTNH